VAAGLQQAGTSRLPNLVQGMNQVLQQEPRFGFNQFPDFLNFQQQGIAAGYRGLNRGLQFDGLGVRLGGVFPVCRYSPDSLPPYYPFGRILIDQN